MEDETPFELASNAIFKMFNEWEAKGKKIVLLSTDKIYISVL